LIEVIPAFVGLCVVESPFGFPNCLGEEPTLYLADGCVADAEEELLLRMFRIRCIGLGC
jgi:hypothetical protein